MSVKDWLTKRRYAKQAINELMRSEIPQDSLLTIGRNLSGDHFKLLMESIRRRIKADWEKEKNPDERENLHSELRALKRLELRINSLSQEFERSIK